MSEATARSFGCPQRSLLNICFEALLMPSNNVGLGHDERYAVLHQAADVVDVTAMMLSCVRWNWARASNAAGSAMPEELY